MHPSSRLLLQFESVLDGRTAWAEVERIPPRSDPSRYDLAVLFVVTLGGNAKPAEHEALREWIERDRSLKAIPGWRVVRKAAVGAD